MAFSAVPTTWIPNWSEDGTNISVPIASFPELTAAEADATTGDIRKIYFAIVEQLRIKWLATPAADRPGKMTFNSSVTVNNETGIVTRTYTVGFQLSPTGLDVTAET